MNKKTRNYELWEHLHNEHGLICTESELEEIIRIAIKMENKMHKSSEWDNIDTYGPSA